MRVTSTPIAASRRSLAPSSPITWRPRNSVTTFIAARFIVSLLDW